MDLIDTHCHLDASVFADDREAVLGRCRDLGVRRLVVPGYVARHWERLFEVCDGHPGLFSAPGLHPMYTASHHPTQLERLERIIGERKVVAIGEIGLDYFIQDPDYAAQQYYLEAQITIAKAARLPLLLHIRKAQDLVTKALRDAHFPHGGIAHAFNGSLQQAEKLVELGFKIGIGGTVTFAKATRIRRMAKALPLEALVLETDAPDIPGEGHQGERNSPEYLPEVVQALAQVRDQSPEEIARVATANAEALLGLA